MRRVLVVHSSDAMASIIETIVRDTGFEPVRARSGIEAIEVLKEGGVRTAIVDVAVSDPYAFELVPMLKTHEGVFVVLLASVYDKTAYKRRPSSLYGADDYLEQHHLPDKLPVLLGSLTASAPPLESDSKVIAHREDLRRAADEQLGNGNRTVGPDASAEALAVSLLGRARTLARKLVMDISLYHDEAFVAGVAHGDLAERLSVQIDEAKRFLAERLPDSFRQGDAGRFIDEALAALQQQRGGGQ